MPGSPRTLKNFGGAELASDHDAEASEMNSTGIF